MERTDVVGQLPLGAIEELHRRRGRFVAMGVALLVLGTIGVVAAGLFTLASVLLFGWLLVIGGAATGAHAFWARRWSGFFLQLAAALLYLVVGALIVTRPEAGAIGLTLLLAAALIVQGVFRCATAFATHVERRGWLLASGAITLLLGIMIWAEWPVSGLWVIGLFVGIDMIFYGWWLVALGLLTRGLQPEGGGRAAG